MCFFISICPAYYDIALFVNYLCSLSGNRKNAINIVFTASAGKSHCTASRTAHCTINSIFAHFRFRKDFKSSGDADLIQLVQEAVYRLASPVSLAVARTIKMELKFICPTSYARPPPRGWCSYSDATAGSGAGRHHPDKYTRTPAPDNTLHMCRSWINRGN